MIDNPSTSCSRDPETPPLRAARDAFREVSKGTAIRPPIRRDKAKLSDTGK
jgi:hypothetical protein